MSRQEGCRLSFDRDALKFLRTVKRGNPKAARQIVERIQALVADPYPASSKQLTGQCLEGRPVRSLRSGVYRVLYLVEGTRREIRILDIAHRQSVYKDPP